MQLDIRTILVLWHPDRRQVLLLRRSPSKKLFPSLITGIGGAVELARGEGMDLEAAVLRELEEETRIHRNVISNVRLRLTSVLSRNDEQVVLLWYTGNLERIPADLSCTEGELAFYPAADLPVEGMVPTAREAIRFVISLTDENETVYSGVYVGKDFRLLTNHPGPPA
jgi:8-oxo-dGTP pyrophosphatase MutT (NUDIX family)